MPVLLAENVAVSPQEMDATRMAVAKKKKSRLSVYLNTVNVNETTEDEFSIFNETDVKNVLEEQLERQKKIKLEKLNLVWKRTYEIAKTPKECLNELVNQRNAPRMFLKIKSNVRMRSYSKVSSERTSSNIDQQMARTESKEKDVDHNDKDLNWIDHNSKDAEGSVHKSICQLELENFSRAATDYDKLLCLWDDALRRPRHSLKKRFSRNIFSTKKATGNQESNLLLYRTERRKAPTDVKAAMKSDGSSVIESLPGDPFQRSKTLQSQQEMRVPELNNKIDVDTLLRAYLSEQFLELSLEGPEVVELRRMYKNTIMNRPVINNLIMKHPDMLPSHIYKDLVIFKKGFEVNPIYAPTIVKTDESNWREVFFRTLSSPDGSVLHELENDIPVYSNFYKSLLERRAEAADGDSIWAHENRPQILREMLLHTSMLLRLARNSPGSDVRFDLIRIMTAAGRNDRLVKQMGQTVESWLDQLAKGLNSSFKSVREETCQVLCFMTSYYPVMRELYVSKYYDVIQDLTIMILRSIDIFDDTFSEYYILLSHIIHYCPARSILDCLIDRWQSFRSIGLILRWPRLIYYALRYWPDDSLNFRSRLFGLRLVKALEAALQRPLTAKVARLALYHLQVRFSNVSRLFTIRYLRESADSNFLAALGVKE